MHEFLIYKTYFLKLAISIKAIFTKPAGVAMLIPTISLALLTTMQLCLIFLFIAFVIDFGTGVLASYCEMKDQKLTVKVYLIESKKLRSSLVKAITYMMLIAFVFGFEKIFFIKEFTFSGISDKSFTVTIIAIAACIVIELLSILENMKRSGYDLLGKIKTSAKKIWALKKTISGE